MESDGQEDDPFYTIKNLTHTVESLLQTYRNMDLGIPSGVVDIILEAVDRSHALAKAIEEDRQEQIVIEDLVQKLQVFSSEENFLPAEGQALVEESNRKLPKQLTAFANITRQGLESISFLVNSAKPGFPVSNKRINQYQRAMNAIIKSARQMEYLDIAELVEEMQAHVGKVKPGDSVDTGFVDELKQQYEVLQSLLDSRIKDIADLCSVPEREYDKKLGEILLAEKKITAEDLEQALKEQRKLGEVLVEKGILKKEDVDLALAKQSMARQQGKESLEPAQAASEVGGQSIRVSQDKMNRLMNMIGELLISKNRIFHLADQINLEYEIPELSRDVKSVAFEISRISDELQDAIMSARMLPLRVLFQRYPRTIRDTARKVGKQADLVVSGEETELDKTVMEAINDPLVHMLRNAVDHGIEPPDVRRALGKPEAGTVWLQARYQGNNVVIEIKDDGKGMDPDEIKAKALKKGLITTEQIETLSMDDTFRLIFAPGFSTRDEVSELSGRGVGMDVVKNNIEKVGGSIAMSSAVNAGSHFTLKIPLSMSIIRGLMIRCGGQQYVIPLDSIEETVKILPSDIRRYKDLLVADIRGGILHLVRLQDILDLEGREPQADSLATAAGPERISVVILENDGHRFGLIVDSFYKEQEFVVKALVEELAQLRIYTGASILGDGNVVLILNPAQLFNTFLHSRKAGEADGDNHSAG
jgi:Chemotaxis protein histidine kinase and related kinases